MSSRHIDSEMSFETFGQQVIDLGRILIEIDQINALARLIPSEPDNPGRQQLANDLQEQLAAIEGQLEAELRDSYKTSIGAK
jgi:hypothetical protein